AGAVVPWPFLTMSQNIHFALAGFPGGAPQDPQAWLSPTWSLAVEEQFYLILPWLIIFSQRDRLIWFLLSAIVVSFALREFMMSHADLRPAAYVLTPTNLPPLFAGVIAAWLVRYHGWHLPSLNGGLILGWIGRRSYALYLFHLPAAYLAVTLMGHSLIAVAS